MGCQIAEKGRTKQRRRQQLRTPLLNAQLSLETKLSLVEDAVRILGYSTSCHYWSKTRVYGEQSYLPSLEAPFACLEV